RLLVRVRGDRGYLGQQPDGGDLHLLRVERVEAVLVEGGQRADRRRQDGHRVGLPGEPVEEPPQVLVQHGVDPDLVREVGQLRGGRQFAVDEQVRDLQEGRVLGQLLDRVAAVAQDARVTVDESDLRGAAGRVDEPRVERYVPGLLEQAGQLEPGRAGGGL